MESWIAMIAKLPSCHSFANLAILLQHSYVPSSPGSIPEPHAHIPQCSPAKQQPQGQHCRAQHKHPSKEGNVQQLPCLCAGGEPQQLIHFGHNCKCACQPGLANAGCSVGLRRVVYLAILQEVNALIRRTGMTTA